MKIRSTVKTEIEIEGKKIVNMRKIFAHSSGQQEEKRTRNDMLLLDEDELDRKNSGDILLSYLPNPKTKVESYTNNTRSW